VLTLISVINKETEIEYETLISVINKETEIDILIFIPTFYQLPTVFP
jgi:hypothetical protein